MRLLGVALLLTAAAAAVTQDSCKAGSKYVASSETCEQCTGDTYTKTKGQVVCQACSSPHSVNPARTQCVPPNACKAGSKYVMSTATCELCAGNTYSASDGVIFCSICNKGFVDGQHRTCLAGWTAVTISPPDPSCATNWVSNAVCNPLQAAVDAAANYTIIKLEAGTYFNKGWIPTSQAAEATPALNNDVLLK